MKVRKLSFDKIFIKDFDTTSASINIWKKFHELNEKIKSEIELKKYLQKRAIIERELKYDNPDYTITRKLIFTDKSEEELIGFYSYSVCKQESILFKENSELGIVELFIEQNYRQQGLGSKILSEILSVLKSQGCTKISISTSHNSGRKFCDKLKGKITNIESKSILDLEKVDWNLVTHWILDGKKKNPDVNLEGFFGVSENKIEDYCLLLSELMNERPTLSQNSDEKFFEIITPQRYREFVQYIEERFYSIYTYRTIEPDGNISGLTELISSKVNNPERLEQGLTGVKSNHRERGLGKWLKAAMLYFVKENLPQAKYWITGNAEHNAAILAINSRLGFKPYYQIFSYHFIIDELLKLI